MHRLLSGTLSPLLLVSCIKSGGETAAGPSTSSLQNMPGMAPEVAEKKPKYRLYCASDLSSLKSPSSSQLVQEFESLDAAAKLTIKDKSKVTDSTYCLIDVVVSSSGHESQFKWFAKGADGKALKGVFYRSNAVKPSEEALEITLYRTYEDVNSGTIDLFAKATFPANTTVKDLKEASLTCGADTHKSISSKPDSGSVSSIIFSLPKSPIVDKSTKCTMTATVGSETFNADNVTIEPKSTNHKVSLNVTLAKAQNDPKTMTIETTIKN